MKNLNKQPNKNNRKVIEGSQIKKPLLLIVFFITVIASLSIIQVAISNMVSTAGIELDYLQSEIAKYKKENTLIEEKVLSESSLTNISKKAKKLGLVEANSKIYLTNPLPLALENSSR